MVEHDIWLESELDAPFPYEEFLRRCITKALELEHVTLPCEINVLITDNEGIHRINLEQRQVDAPTDVLSFPDGTADPDSGVIALGDVVICARRAEEQARSFGHSFQRELAYLTAHSVLHLLGYDHVDSEEDDRIMRQKQNAVMRAMGLELDHAD